MQIAIKSAVVEKLLLAVDEVPCDLDPDLQIELAIIKLVNIAEKADRLILQKNRYDAKKSKAAIVAFNDWYDERVELDKKATAPLADVMRNYKEYCANADRGHLSKSQLLEFLRGDGVSLKIEKHGNRRVLHGIRIKTDDEIELEKDLENW